MGAMLVSSPTYCHRIQGPTRSKSPILFVGTEHCNCVRPCLMKYCVMDYVLEDKSGIIVCLVCS